MSSLYRALRGVCIGVGKTLLPDDPPVALDSATAQFLVSIGAVAKVDAAPPAASAPAASPAETKPESEPVKPAASAPAAGKKEK